MGWQDQGRQEHGWFGHGTSGAEPDRHARRAATSVAYSALAQLPPGQRSAFEGWLNRGGIDHVSAVLPGWAAGSALPKERFHGVFFGPHGSVTVAGHAQAVGQALAAHAEERTAVGAAGRHFADMVTLVRPEGMGRVMAGAAAQAQSPAAQGLVHEIAARRTAPAAPARPAARPLSPAEALRQRNIAALARVLYNEARGNGQDAMVAVAHTVRNRMLRNGATSVEQVWGRYKHSMPHPINSLEADAYTIAKRLAGQVLDGRVPDATNGATHYYSPQQMPLGDEAPTGDTAGGLETVPGVLSRKDGKPATNYRPGWSIDPQYERRLMPALPERDFKFYRKSGVGRVR